MKNNELFRLFPMKQYIHEYEFKDFSLEVSYRHLKKQNQ